MNGYCFEQYLIDNCSPTLASLKTANLFNYRYSSTDELNKAVERWNKELSGKGITVTVLRKRENTALIYVYRAKCLAKDFSRPGVERFMKCHGYENTDIDLCLKVLGGKLAKSDLFPHEIGLFLGYPLGDVIGFIDNEGKTADARAVGRYTATSARLCAPLRDLTSAELFTKRCGQTAGVSCSLRLHNIKNIRMKGFLL